MGDVSAVNIDVSGVVKGVADGLDKLFTSDEERAEGERKIAELMQQPHILQAMANVKAASNTNWFVAGGRPALLWVAAIALLYNWLLKDMIMMAFVMLADESVSNHVIPMMPYIDDGQITALVATMLGLGGLRTYEKTKGVARSMG